MFPLMEDYNESIDFNSKKCKGVFFEFGVHYLLHQPKDFCKYATWYFKKKANRPKTKLVYDFNQRDVYHIDPYAGYTMDERRTMVFDSTYMLNCVPKEDLEKAMKLAKRKEIYPDETIINQWDPYDEFYIIERGIFNAYMSLKQGHLGKVVHTYHNSGAFGELAFMARQPRATTIIADTRGYLWYMTSDVFCCYIRKPVKRHRNTLGKFYDKFEIFKKLHPYQLIQLCDATQIKHYKKGETIMQQGFFSESANFVMEGVVCAVIIDNIIKDHIMVEKYHPLEAFGYFEILMNTVLYTSAIATCDCTIAAVHGDYFLSLPSFIMNYFKKDVADYMKIVEKRLKEIIEQHEQFKLSAYYKSSRHLV